MQELDYRGMRADPLPSLNVAIPLRYLPPDAVNTIDRLRGHMSADEWVLTLVQRELHDPAARVYR